jgi:ADP-ribose pyrophosphatase YjhB (NUDIX family)
MNAIISCGCCVIKYVGNTPHILLVRPSYRFNVWGIPKGHIEQGETYEMCACRETYEETGIVPVIIEFVNAVNTFSKRYNKTVYAFLAYPTDSNYVPGSTDGENCDVRYFSMNRLPEVHPYQVSLLKDTFRKVLELPKSSFMIGAL